MHLLAARFRGHSSQHERGQGVIPCAIAAAGAALSAEGMPVCLWPGPKDGLGAVPHGAGTDQARLLGHFWDVGTVTPASAFAMLESREAFQLHVCASMEDRGVWYCSTECCGMMVDEDACRC